MSDAFLEVALDAATRSGDLLRSRFGSPRDIGYKGGPTNLVTEMDSQAEALIVEAIRHRFPDHAILAEESGASRGSAPYRWIVDPLELGVVVDPSRHERFTARRGTGAFLNGQPISVSETPSVEKSLLSTGYPYDIRGGRVSHMNGSPLDVSSASMLASNGRIHAEILETLKAVKARAGKPGRHQEPREPRA